jgi:predicted site-specific integrase-resolvase
VARRQLVGTGEAAAAVGIARSPLWRHVQEGKVTPTLYTAGGHARFDIEELKQQLRRLAKERRHEDD